MLASVIRVLALRSGKSMTARLALRKNVVSKKHNCQMKARRQRTSTEAHGDFAGSKPLTFTLRCVFGQGLLCCEPRSPRQAMFAPLMLRRMFNLELSSCSPVVACRAYDEVGLFGTKKTLFTFAAGVAALSCNACPALLRPRLLAALTPGGICMRLCADDRFGVSQTLLRQACSRSRRRTRAL